MEFLILIALIILNGLFAMSEIALLTARKARLMKLANEGDKAAKVALELGEDPTRFLSTVQIGITSISILNGMVGESVFAEPLSHWLQSLGWHPQLTSIGSTVLVVVIVTYISIVIGELVPKRIGQNYPELIARIVAYPMRILAVLTQPFVRLLTFSTNTLMRLMGIQANVHGNGVAEEEIHALLEEGSENGVIEQHQHEMVRNVFRLDDRQLGSLMVPRSDIVFLDTAAPLEENLRRVAEFKHSRFPVCEGGFENLVGVIHAKQLLAYTAKGQTPDFKTDLQACLFVPETLTAMELLEQFRSNSIQIAFVVDEYGELEGMITLRDLLEVVTGELSPRDSEEAWAMQREDGSWLLDGAIPIPELKDCLELKTVPEEDKGRFHTLSGMIMLLLGSIPKTGDRVDWEDWRFEVVDMDQKRIDKVLASVLPAKTEAIQNPKEI